LATAIRHHIIQATSAGIERHFSLTGIICSEEEIGSLTVSSKHCCWQRQMRTCY